MIKFKLKGIDEISPFGNENKQTVHWFALTDGEYWIEAGNTTLFEYTEEVLSYWEIEGRENKYTNYQVVRFYEDFTELFYKIPESIPGDLFELICSSELLNKFNRKIGEWIEYNAIRGKNIEDPEISLQYLYEVLIRQRTLSSGHLKYGPMIYFFRKGNKMHLIWDAEDIIDNKIPVWTAGSGELEMRYQEFVNQVEEFGKCFFQKMKIQVQQAIMKDWGDIKIDKPRLLEEQAERIDHFNYSLRLLKEKKILPHFITDWAKIRDSLEKLKK